MPSVQYMNRSAPFWDFVANLEQEGANHPFFSQWAPPRNEAGDEDRRGPAAHPHPPPPGPPPPFGPFGWGFPFGGGRGFPHHGPPPPPPGFGPPPHHEEHDEDADFEKDFEKELNKEFEDDNEKQPQDKENEEKDNGEGPSGSGSDNEGCCRRRGGDRPRRGGGGGPCGSRRGGRGCGPRGGPFHGPPPHHHGHHGHHGGHHGPGRRGGGWGGWGRWNRGGPFNSSTPNANNNPLSFLSTLFDAAAPSTTTEPASEDFSPDADIFDTPTAFVVHLSLPGAKKEDVGVNWDVEKSELSIAGVIYRPGDERFLEQLAMGERKVGAFERKVRLGTRANPANVDVDGISAKLEDGVLRVEVPKMGEGGFVEVKRVDVE